jgi:hypothetical protein
MQNHNTRIEEPNTTNTNRGEDAYLLLREFIPDHRVPDGRNLDAGLANWIL